MEISRLNVRRVLNRRIQVKTATNPKRRQPKRRQIQNGDTPKRPQTKTATRQNGDQTITATLQNGDNQNGDTSKTATHPKRRQPKRCMSQFWPCRRFGFVAVLDTSKHGVLERNQVGCVAVLVFRRLDRYPFKIQVNTAFWREIKLDLSPFWFCRRFGVSPFWIQVNTAFWREIKLDLSPFWICRRFGNNQIGDTCTKTAGYV